MSLARMQGRTAHGGLLGETGALFLALAIGLAAFGVLMIYSSSSIMALTAQDYGHNPAYFALRQLAFALAGSVLLAVTWLTDYHLWSERILLVLWAVVVLLLLFVFMPFAGQDAYGATRWIRIGSFTLQPSEFAKAAVIASAASIFRQYFEDGSITFDQLVLRTAILVGVPMVLVLAQPDKGSVAIMGLTVLLMLFLAGMPLQVVGVLAVVGVAGILVLAMGSDYSRARIMIMSDPWVDPYGDGYQLIQGYYAFGSGGLLGVGLGMSRQKYSYLPMAHNDFILAVIGEELGFVGCAILLLAFFALVWLGFKIAREAPDLTGRLIASGSVTMLCLQLLVNASGVLGLIPLSGKPVPFISYGGSSIIATLLLVGMVLSVSHASQAAQPFRSGFGAVEGGTGRGFRVIEGGASSTPSGIRAERGLAERSGARISRGANGRERIDLGPSGADRLRGR